MSRGSHRPPILEPLAYALFGAPLLGVAAGELLPLILIGPVAMAACALTFARGPRASDLSAIAAMSALALFPSGLVTLALVLSHTPDHVLRPATLFVHLTASYGFGAIGLAALGGEVGPRVSRTVDVVALVLFAVSALLSVRFESMASVAAAYTSAGALLAVRVGWWQERGPHEDRHPLVLLGLAGLVWLGARLCDVPVLPGAAAAAAIGAAVARLCEAGRAKRTLEGTLVDRQERLAIVDLDDGRTVAWQVAEAPRIGTRVTVRGTVRELPGAGPFRSPRPLLLAVEVWPCDRATLVGGLLRRAATWTLFALAVLVAFLFR